MPIELNYAQFYRALETWLTETIRSCYPYSWNEDHITFSITDRLFERGRLISVTGLDRPFRLVWDVRKLRKPEEVDHGDLAVLVNLKTWAGETLEGVGLLEAKRRDPSKSSFSSANATQLKRIVAKSPSARLLLYDYDSVTACMDNCSSRRDDYYHDDRWGPVQPYTHSVCLPALTALQQGRFSTELHKFGVPLSYQIAGRYFRGFDLELKQKTLDAVKGNLDRHGGARALLLVGLSTGADSPKLPEVNSNRYLRND